MSDGWFQSIISEVFLKLKWLLSPFSESYLLDSLATNS